MKKKIMLLGGNYYQMTATKTAKALGFHVISADYLPDNPAHKFADEYYNVSTTDREAVLALARKLKIDGICTYASDVSAATVAYVAEKMSLPGNPLNAVETLTQKDLMRDFLKKNNFNVPQAQGFTTYDDAFEFFKTFQTPAMIKPVDSSGSKGVTKVSRAEDFRAAYDSAMKYSRSKRIIVEEFVQRKGYLVAGDSFFVDGKLQFSGLVDCHFDKLGNPFVPIGESYPTALDNKLKVKAKSELQRLVRLLGIKTSAINADTAFDEKENFYILEAGPRNGGNLISDAIKAACGVDLPKYTIMAALGMDCSDLKELPIKNFVSSYVIHSLSDGIFKALRVSDELKKNILRCDLFVKPGEKIYRFENGGFGIGAMLLKFDSVAEMNHRIDNMEDCVECILE